MAIHFVPPRPQIHQRRRRILASLPQAAGGPASLVLPGNVLHYAFDSDVLPTIIDTSTSPVTSLLHFDGTNGSSTFTDDAGHTWTPQVSPVLDTSQSKFGASSLHLANGGYDRLNGDGAIVWNTQDLTIDFWLKLDGAQAGQTNLFYLNYPTPVAVLYIAAAGGVLRFYVGSDTIVGTTSVTTSVWHHIALTRQGANHYLFLDGNLEGVWNYPGANYFTAAASYPCIGAGSGISPVGWFDELRIVIGTAAWTSNFTPPTAAYTTAVIANNNTGTLLGPLTETSVTGHIGNALNFPISSTASVGFANAGALGLGAATSEITVCCWYKSTNANNPIYCIRNSGNGNTVFDFLVGCNLGTPGFATVGLQIRGDDGSGLTTVVTTTSNVVNDGNWHHIAVTRNSSKLNTIYIDGASVASGTDTLSAGVTPVATGTFIGREVLNGWYISGTSPVTAATALDDFQIYSRALTSVEVNSIYSYTTTPATQWQGTAFPAGAGSLTATANLLMAASSVFAGSSLLTATGALAVGAKATLAGASALTSSVNQWLAANVVFAGAGSLAVANLGKLLGTATFAGVGAFAINEDQWFAARATLAGTGALTATGLVYKPLQGAFAGAGTASWPTIDPTDQWMAASSTLAGSGSLAGDATRVAAAGILWQAVLDPWVGASTLAVQAAAQLPIFSSMAGVAALAAQAALWLPAKAALSGAGAASWPTINPINQLLVATSALAGAGAATQSLLTLRPIAAALSGVGTELASITARMPSAAALAGTGTFASSLSQALLLSSAAWAGASGALSSLAQQLSVAVPFAGASTLTGDAPVLRTASAAFAGSSILNAASAQWLATSVATIGGAGLLTSAPIQWQNIATLASGTGALGGDVYIPGHNVWSAVLNVWPATGSLTAATIARFAAVTAPWAAASTLASSLTARSPISAVAAAGAGQLAPAISSLQLATNASWSGAGALAANYRQLLTITGSVLTGLVGGLATTPAQWMSATSALSGAGAIVGDITRLTGGILRPIDAVVYLGTSALTAQTTQLLTGLTAWSGAGALSSPSVSITEPVTLSPAGQGSMAASAAMRMSAVFAAAGVGSLTSDVQRFTPGIQQGSALLVGASLLVAASSQYLATNVALAGQGTAIDRLAQGMAAGAFLSGAGALLSAEGLRLQARSVLAGSGLLQVDVLTPRGLAALFAATSSLQASSRLLGSLVATQAGAGSLAAKTIGALATQSLLSSSSQLTTGLTAFEQIAGTLAAAGYSAAYLGEIQWLGQQILFGTGVLGANLVQTSIRVVTATIIGRPSESSGIIGRNPIAATITGQDPRAGIIGRKPTATAMTGQDPRAGVVGQGDFVTLH